jgi:hypothetical protein
MKTSAPRAVSSLTSKIHALVDTNGLPAHLALTPLAALSRQF